MSSSADAAPGGDAPDAPPGLARRGSGARHDGDARATRAGVTVVVCLAAARAWWAWSDAHDPVAAALAAAGAYGCLLAFVVAHEGAHALVGWAVGLPISDARVGCGPRVLTLRAGVVPWRFHLVPVGGHVRWMPYGRTWGKVATALAGPLGPLLLASVAGSTTLWVLAVVGLGNLWPREGSDGEQVARLIGWQRARRDGGASAPGSRPSTGASPREARRLVTTPGDGAIREPSARPRAGAAGDGRWVSRES